MIKEVNVICIKWGEYYGGEYANKLYNMIKRNTNYKVNFYCFTDNNADLDKDIIVEPLPTLNVEQIYIDDLLYRKTVALSNDNLANLKGQRVFFFDLDLIIIDNLDEFFDFPSDDKFYIINDWNTKGDHVGQASCYSWVVGTIGYVKEHFEKNPKQVVDRYRTATQQYLSHKIIEKQGSLSFWPEKWFCSFRFHCIPSIPLRFFKVPSIPNWKGLKVVVFHGTPNPREAIKGIWPLKDSRTWKRLYKVCKPTKWIEKYWH